jgi:C1A family cysteine protease
LQASPLEAFNQWLARYNKDYVNDTLEKTKRLGVFKSNVATIAQHNSNPASTFIMAINEFADLTFEEFASTRLGLNMSLGGDIRDRVEDSTAAGTPFRYGDLNENDLPSEIDWRKNGAVTPVKNQGMCGSCKLPRTWDLSDQIYQSVRAYQIILLNFFFSFYL